MHMNTKETQRRIAYEALIILLMLGLLMFVCRLWPILLLAILGIFVAAIRLLFLSCRQVPAIEPLPAPQASPREPTAQDVLSIAYALILKRVSELVQREYPNARWVWESPQVKELIQNGGELFILLNHAGGYCRAQVLMTNLQVTGLAYQTAALQSEPKATAPEAETTGEIEQDTEEPVPNNYELLAFEWVEANMMSLNSRCNEAIGLGLEELIIYADELPVRESWPDICRELMHNDLDEVSCVQDGIRIELAQ